MYESVVNRCPVAAPAVATPAAAFTPAAVAPVVATPLIGEPQPFGDITIAESPGASGAPIGSA